MSKTPEIPGDAQFQVHLEAMTGGIRRVDGGNHGQPGEVRRTWLNRQSGPQTCPWTRRQRWPRWDRGGTCQEVTGGDHVNGGSFWATVKINACFG